MNCPECNGQTHVVDSRIKKEGIRRRRECLSCKHRFSTIEIDVDVYTELNKSTVKALRKKVGSAMQKIKASLYEILE